MKYVKKQLFKHKTSIERTGYSVNILLPMIELFAMFTNSVCFVALHSKSTAVVMAGQSVHLTTLFSWASLNKWLTSTSCTYFRL